MALPPKVIDQLSRESVATPGWSGRLLMFTFTLFILSLVGYFGIAFGYSKYLNQKIQEADLKVKSQNQQIPEEYRDEILVFFSQLSNLRLILDKHINASSLFNLLEATTHSKVYYTRLMLNSDKNEAVLTGMATSVADITEQVKIFQGRPEIERVSLGNINKTDKGWQFDVTMVFTSQFLSTPALNGGAVFVPLTAPVSAPTSTPTSTPTR